MVKRKLDAPEDPPSKKSKSQSGFVTKWTIDFPWVEYNSETKTMHCKVCRKHLMMNKFAKSGSSNFKRTALSEHVISDEHKTAMSADLSSRTQPLKSMFKQNQSNTDQAMCHMINTAYTVAKENLPIIKYEALCKLMLKNKTPMTSTLYHDTTSCMDFITIISDLIEQEVLRDIKASPVIGIIVDESTDMSTEKHLILYVSYVKNCELKIKFVKLLKLSACDAVTITSHIMSFLNSCGIDKNKVVGFGSDGASVMLGKEGGVVALLKEFYPYLTEMHCSAHRLALACVDVAKLVPEVRYFESVVTAIYTYFKRSTSNMELLKLFQDLLDEAKLKPKEIHRVRWLSMSESIKVVRQSYKSILHVTRENKDSDIIANSLYNNLHSYKFLYLTHFYSDIFGGLSVLCKNLQRSGITYRDVQLSVRSYQSNLDMYLQDPPAYGPYLQMFLDGVDHENDCFNGISFERSAADNRLDRSVSQLVNALINNLSSRFPELELHAAFSVLYPSEYPSSRQDLNAYDRAQVQKLAAKFNGIVDADELVTEWHECKSKVFDNYRTLSASELYSELERENAYPNIQKLLAISLTLPSTSVDCERGFSIQNLIKTRNRCSMTITQLDKLMRIMILGPPVHEFDPQAALNRWRNPERHIYKSDTRTVNF